jgi:hypothetical protein
LRFPRVISILFEAMPVRPKIEKSNVTVVARKKAAR